MSERDLAARVVEWLHTHPGIEVYQEVQSRKGGPRADIVAVLQLPRRVWAIECKTTAGLAVLEQAHGWMGRAHLVSVAVPRASRFFALLARQHGIGILTLAHALCEVREELRPRLCARAKWKIELLPQHQTACAAGSACGGHWTPYRETCRVVLGLVKERPGISVAEVCSVPYHWSSRATARRMLAHWVREGMVPGVVGRPGASSSLRLWPV